MIFSLPIPPSANNLFFNVTGRGRVMTNDYRMWRTNAGLRINLLKSVPYDRPYGIHIRANVNHKRDIDNLAKPLIDLLVSQNVISGDQWVNTLRIDRDRSIDGCTVEIWSEAA